MSKLLPCPFCGNSNILNPINDNGWLCKVCGSEWYRNTRPIEDKLQAELARRDEIITRLKEDAERLAILQLVGTKFVCRFCNAWIDGSKREEPTHAPDCPITLHRALMKELE